MNWSTAGGEAGLQDAASDALLQGVGGTGNFVMRQVQRSRSVRFALLASGVMLLLGGQAGAQTVQVFDNAPPIEQLRHILIPESYPGASRSIVLQHTDVSAASGAVQRASTQVMQVPHAAVQAPVQPQPQPQAVPAAATIAAAPAAEPDAAAAGAVAFHVNFAFDSAALPDSARPMIDLIAQLMKETPQVKVRVEGHTDAKGAFEYNKLLSERRALSVAQYLVKQGVEPARLILSGKGPTEPLVPNRFDPANRRVQFVRVS